MKIRYRLITVCFMVDLILFCVVRYLLHKDSYFYNTGCGILLMIVIAILSLDKKLVEIRWRRSLWLSWFAMCIAFTYSDIVVQKQACGLGLILALVFTGVFFVWQNHTRRDLLWKSFKDAVRWAFLLMSFVAFLFRPYMQGGRYAGIFTNPNMFGLYLYVVFAVYMSELDWAVQSKRPLKKSIWMFIQLAMVVFFISISQARTSVLAVLAIFVTWIICRLIVNHGQRAYGSFIRNALTLLVACVALYPIFYFGITRLPKVVNHPIVFQDDVLYMANGEKIEDIGDRILKEAESAKSEEVKVATPDTKGKKDMAQNNVLIRMFRSFDGFGTLNKLSSGRMTIYQAYSQRLNYKGHRSISMKINGKKVAHAHNNWLQFGYTYGIMSMAFYFLITILGVMFALKLYLIDYRKKGSYCFLPLAIIVGFVVATLTECLFLPFEVFPAFAFWFAFCDLFEKKMAVNTLKKKHKEIRCEK